jgi:hypothetical protein
VRRSLNRLTIPLLALAFLSPAGCGGDETEEDAPSVQGVGELRAGSSAALAQCSDWRRGTRAERLQTIEDLRGQLTPQTSESTETGYPDDEAYSLFQRVCAQEYASGFRLYKLYGQAAAFAPLRPEAE